MFNLQLGREFVEAEKMGTNVETREESMEDNRGAEKAPAKVIEPTAHEDNKLDIPLKMEVSILIRTLFTEVILVCIIDPHKLNMVLRGGRNRCHYGQPSLLITNKLEYSQKSLLAYLLDLVSDPEEGI